MMRVKVLGMAAMVAGGLAVAAAAQAAPAFDAGLSGSSAAEITPVQYYGYGYGYAPRPYYGYRPRPYYGYGYGESPQHYWYRRAHRAYRAEHYWRYGY